MLLVQKRAFTHVFFFFSCFKLSSVGILCWALVLKKSVTTELMLPDAVQKTERVQTKLFSISKGFHFLPNSIHLAVFNN